MVNGAKDAICRARRTEQEFLPESADARHPDRAGYETPSLAEPVETTDTRRYDATERPRTDRDATLGSVFVEGCEIAGGSWRTSALYRDGAANAVGRPRALIGRPASRTASLRLDELSLDFREQCGAGIPGIGGRAARACYAAQSTSRGSARAGCSPAGRAAHSAAAARASCGASGAAGAVHSRAAAARAAAGAIHSSVAAA